MIQKNAPKNTEENMSVFEIHALFYYAQYLTVDKFSVATVYNWLSYHIKDHTTSKETIGQWRLTKKRENKNSEWEKVLDSKITNEQRLDRLDLFFKNEVTNNFETLSKETELYKSNLN